MLERRSRGGSVTKSRKLSGKDVIPAVFLVLAALPAVKPIPVYPAPTYETYEPSYSPVYPSYSPPVYPSYSPPVYPSYSPPVYPSYSPPAPVYYPAPAPTYYPVPQYYQEYDNYDAVTYQELNISTHCGVIPATNDELYGNSDVSPFGKYPFIVVIEDEYYNFVCQGVMLHWRYVLTAKSCIQGSIDNYRVRFGDWDLLTNYNEYEAYKNFNTRICRAFPVSYDSSLMSYSYGGYDAELLLLITDFPENVADKYPQVNSICLPQYYNPSYSYPSYTPQYSSPPYNPPPMYPAPYSPPVYNPAPYSPPVYNAPPYYAPTYSYPYSECYVVGWYASPTTQLQNHQPPTPMAEAPSSYSYGYQPPYNPPQYYQQYYEYQDQSKIPRKATVKEIKCPYQAPQYGYSSPPASGYGYSSYQDEEVCFVGVYGSDACVADKGAAIFCMVPERYSGYEAGYSNYEQSSGYGYGYNPAPYTASYPAYEQSYYKQDITCAASPQKPERRRAVLYAIVQEITTCQQQQQYSYGYNAQQQQSNPIRATKVTQQVVEAIVDNYWTNSYDKSCPSPRTYYPQPEIYYQASYSYNPPAYPVYSPPVYEAPSYYSPPVYEAPSYYTPPVYSPPVYEAPSYYTPPVYEAPSYYTPPVYEAPSYYTPPVYSSPPPYYSPAPVYEAPSYYTPPVYSSPPPYYSPAPTYTPPVYSPPYY